MTFEITWHRYGHSIRVTLDSVFTRAHLDETDKQIATMTAGADGADVHVMFDAAHLRQVMISPHQATRQLSLHHSTSLASVVIYGVLPTFRASASILGMVANGAWGLSVQFASTLAHAEDYIARVDNAAASY